MNFDWTEEEKQLAQKVKDLFSGEAGKKIQDMEDADVEKLKGMTQGFLKSLAGTGYLKEALGPGSRKELLKIMAAQEELSSVSSSLFTAVETSTRLFGGLLAGWGSGKTPGEILDQLRSGRTLGAVALSEPGSDAPSEGMNTKAKAQGDDYVLSGEKSYVTNGPFADFIAVGAAVDGKNVFFVVKPDQDGVETGPRLKTMGYNGLAVCALTLKDVKVPADCVLGPFDDDGAIKYLSAMQDFILTMASLGVTGRMLDASNKHSRAYFRGKKPIYAHQEVRFKISDMFVLYQTSQLVARRAGWFWATEDPEADVLISCAKVFSAEAAEQVAGPAMQIMAGRGYVSPNPVEQGYRDSKYAALAGTSSEISRMNIADAILKRYAI